MQVEYQACPNISNDLARQIADAYISVGMGTAYENAVIKALIENSSYYVLALSGGDVIGLIRVLSDGVLTSWIAEILVKPGYQGRGIGTEMLQRVKHKYANTSIYTHADIGQSVNFFAKNDIPVRPSLVSCAKAPQH